MKAARYYGPGDIRVEDISEPVPTEGQVKVKVILLSNLLDFNGLIGQWIGGHRMPGTGTFLFELTILSFLSFFSIGMEVSFHQPLSPAYISVPNR
jgi:hypothetical protein